MLVLNSKTIQLEQKITDREHALLALTISCYIENLQDNKQI